MSRRSLLVLLAATALGVAALAAYASAPPVGRLPKGPTTRIEVPRGLLFSLALPKPAAGLAWRGARNSDPRVARPLYDADVEGSVVLVYRAVRPGTATIVYALTRDETPKALQARYFVVTVP